MTLRKTLVPLGAGCALVAPTLHAQTIVEAYSRAWSFSIDSEGTIKDPGGFVSEDPSVAPFVFDLSSELYEPLSTPFVPTYHRSSMAGQSEAIGDVWTGSAAYSVEYPEALDPSQSYGPSNIVSGSVALHMHKVTFTLGAPTPVTLTGMFRTDQVDPTNPTPIDGFRMEIENELGDTVLMSDFDALLSGVDQTYADSAVLIPGTYSFSAFGQLAALEMLGYRSAESSFDYTVTFVPAPGAGLGVMMSVLCATRRRH